VSASPIFTSELEALRRSVALLTAVAEHAPARLRVALLDAIEELTLHVDALGSRPAARDGAELLEEENERLRAQIGAKDVLLGAVAHELRGPLSAILGYALTLERGTMVTEEERAIIVGRLADRARAMSQTVEDLLDLDLFARGVLTLRRERIGLETLVRDAVTLARLGDRLIEIDGGEVVAALDRPRALRMIRALIEAAAALTPSPLRITLEQNETTVAVLITSQPSAETESVSPEGARLALTLASTLAEIHAGRVSVAPREGGAVWLRLEVPRGF